VQGRYPKLECWILAATSSGEGDPFEANDRTRVALAALKDAGVVTTTELIDRLRAGKETAGKSADLLPDQITDSDAILLRQHAKSGKYGPTSLQTALEDAGVNTQHAIVHARAIQLAGTNTAEELAKTIARSLPLPCNISSTDAQWLREQIAATPMHPCEWRGSARLRVELSGRHFVATARGTSRLLPQLLAVVRLHVSELQKQFPGLKLDIRKPTPVEAIGALSLAVAKRSMGLCCAPLLCIHFVRF
jgi:hypothetical protein